MSYCETSMDAYKMWMYLFRNFVQKCFCYVNIHRKLTKVNFFVIGFLYSFWIMKTIKLIKSLPYKFFLVYATV